MSSAKQANSTKWNGHPRLRDTRNSSMPPSLRYPTVAKLFVVLYFRTYTPNKKKKDRRDVNKERSRTEDARKQGSESEASGGHAEHQPGGQNAIPCDVELHHNLGLRASRSALKQLQLVVDRVRILQGTRHGRISASLQKAEVRKAEQPYSTRYNKK